MEAHQLIDPAFWVSRETVAPGSEFPKEVSDPMGLVWFRTSGSTGLPKWIGLSREALLLSAAVVNRHLGITSDEKWGLCLPIYHVGGFGVIARAFESGCKLSISKDKWNPHVCNQWLKDKQVNHLSLVPTQLYDLVKAGLEAPSCLRTLVVGGGSLDEGLATHARDLGWPVLASFGMTEAGSQVATQEMDQLKRPTLNRAIPVLPHWDVRIGSDKRIEIRGDSLFSAQLVKGVWGWEYKGQEDGWFRTGDIGRLSRAGLEILGRADTQVKILGELVDPADLERKLGVEGLVIIAVPDERRGHRLVAVIEEGATDPIALLDEHNQYCEGIHRIDEEIWVEKLPRNELGKVQRGIVHQALRT